MLFYSPTNGPCLLWVSLVLGLRAGLLSGGRYFRSLPGLFLGSFWVPFAKYTEFLVVTMQCDAIKKVHLQKLKKAKDKVSFRKRTNSVGSLPCTVATMQVSFCYLYTKFPIGTCQKSPRNPKSLIYFFCPTCTMLNGLCPKTISSHSKSPKIAQNLNSFFVPHLSIGKGGCFLT